MRRRGLTNHSKIRAKPPYSGMKFLFRILCKKKSPSAAGFGSSASFDANEPDGDQACLEVDDWPMTMALRLAAIYI